MPGVMFGYVHAGASAQGGIRPEFVRSLIAAMTGDAGDLIGDIGEASAGASVATARNVLTVQFLGSSCEWLWSVDTDMVFDHTTLPRLLQVAADTRVEQRPVVSAYAEILDARRGPMPSAYELTADGYQRLAKVQPGRLIRADAVGAACLLVHRSVFEKIAAEDGPAWWNHIQPAEGPELGEDLSFCDRVGRAGFPIWLHSGIRVGHMKAIMIGDVS
jgi:GT2 family glycosyltransferase